MKNWKTQVENDKIAVLKKISSKSKNFSIENEIYVEFPLLDDAAK